MAWCDDLGLHAEIAGDSHEHDCCETGTPASEEGYAPIPGDEIPHAYHVTVEFPFMTPTTQIDDSPVQVAVAFDLPEAHLLIARATSARDVPIEPTGARARITVQLL